MYQKGYINNSNLIPKTCHVYFLNASKLISNHIFNNVISPHSCHSLLKLNFSIELSYYFLLALEEFKERNVRNNIEIKYNIKYGTVRRKIRHLSMIQKTIFRQKEKGWWDFNLITK